MGKINQGVELLTEWLAKDDWYESKQARLNQLKDIDLEELVIKVYTSMAYHVVPETFVSASSIMAAFLTFSDHADSIKTVAEIIAILAETDMYDLFRKEEGGTFYVVSNLDLPETLRNRIARCRYLPPMVCPPEEIRKNWNSAYLTFNDGIVLGRNKTHGGDLCLDVINTQNQVELKLDLDFLCSVEEEPSPSRVLDTPEKQQNWDTFKFDSYATYEMIAHSGNRFYIPNKLDSRGRMYAQGYYITPQGTAFKKAQLEFAKEEYLEGMP